MFLEYYGLKQEPFGVTPDPRFLFPTATHREALAAIRYGIEAGRGFLALMAPPGMGKTTLLFRLLKHLQGSARTVFLFQTISNPTDLMRYLLMDLGVDHLRDMVSMHRELNQILFSEANAGRRFVLVIDEAQNLSEPVLEAARLLSNFETPTTKLMQIVLSGQPELAAKLNRPSMSQLRQRISIFTRLEPFKPEETFAYIEHRLNVAGHEGPPIFTRAAMELIAEHSQGIPRNINNLCSNSLSLGFAVEQTQIGAGVVNRVIADLSLPAEAPIEAPKALSAAAGAEGGTTAPGEPKPKETVSIKPNRVFTPPSPKMPLPAPDPGPRPSAAADPVPEIVFDEELQMAVMRLAPKATLVPPSPKSSQPAKAAAPTAAPEVPFGERIRWPVSSLSMIGGVSAAPPRRYQPAALPEPAPAVEPPRTQTATPAPEPVAAKPAAQTELHVPAASAAEPLVREIHLGGRFTLRIDSTARKIPIGGKLSRPEPRDYRVPVLGAEALAKDTAEQQLFSKASWVLISLAFLLTLYISTKLYFAEPEEGPIPVTSSVAAAPAPQAEPSEPMDPIPHVVQQHETIEGIARFYLGRWDSTVRAEIFKINPKLNTNQLRPGQQILIPRRLPDAPAAAIPQTPDAAAEGQARPYE
jgi:type II secretory pathway predicted ATPase ExeA